MTSTRTHRAATHPAPPPLLPRPKGACFYALNTARILSRPSSLGGICALHFALLSLLALLFVPHFFSHVVIAAQHCCVVSRDATTGSRILNQARRCRAGPGWGLNHQNAVRSCVDLVPVQSPERAPLMRVGFQPQTLWFGPWIPRPGHSARRLSYSRTQQHLKPR